MADEEVVESDLATSREDAFHRLADRHLDASYRLARAILGNPAEAEDATHDAFVTAWRNWSNLRDPSRFERWFERILVNICRNRLRSNARRRTLDTSPELELIGTETTGRVRRRRTEDHHCRRVVAPWHDHWGPALLVNAGPGTLTSAHSADCVAREYGPGTALVYPGQGNLHTAVNNSGEDVVLYAIFLGVGNGPVLPADPPPDCDPFWSREAPKSRVRRRPLDIPATGRSSLAAMKVSELARRTGTTTKAIRFYEAEGVLPAPPRAPNGYREYGEADLCRTRVLVSLRNLGINLPESGRLASLCAADRCDEMAVQLIDVVRERRAAVVVARAELDHLEGELANLEAALGGTEPKTNLCLGKEVN